MYVEFIGRYDRELLDVLSTQLLRNSTGEIMQIKVNDRSIRTNNPESVYNSIIRGVIENEDFIQILLMDLDNEQR